MKIKVYVVWEISEAMMEYHLFAREEDAEKKWKELRERVVSGELEDTYISTRWMD